MGTLTINWTIPIGTTTHLGRGAIAIHPTEPTFYVCGGNVQAANPQGILIKADFSGAQQWQQVITAPQGCIATHVAIAPDGQIYVLGLMATQPDTAMSDLWLAGYQPDGQQKWLKKLHCIHPQHPDSCAIDAQGFIYVAGHTLPTNGEGEGWLARYDPEGQPLWRTTLGQYTTPQPLQVWIGNDPTARTKFARIAVYIAGSTRMPIAGSEEGEYTWLARYSSEGIQRWIASLGPAAAVAVQGLHTDANDHIYAIGHAHQGGAIALGSAQSAIAPGLFLAHYDVHGEPIALNSCALDAQMCLVGSAITPTGITLMGVKGTENTIWQAVYGLDGTAPATLNTVAFTADVMSVKGAIAPSGAGFLLGQSPTEPAPTATPDTLLPLYRQWVAQIAITG